MIPWPDSYMQRYFFLLVLAVTLCGMGLVPSARAASPSGADMPLGDLPGWRQIFTDDFTTVVPLESFPSAVSTK
jgi:hypothetical protein